MTNVSYSVIFSGEIAEGQDVLTVQQKVSGIFKNKHEIENIFSGKKWTIKKNIDMHSAIKLKAAFEKTGAICSIVPSINESISSQQEIPETISSNATTSAKRNTEDINKIDNETQICPKCQFISDHQDDECPRCGVIYKKAEAPTERSIDINDDQNQSGKKKGTIVDPSLLVNNKMFVYFFITGLFCFALGFIIGKSDLVGNKKEAQVTVKSEAESFENPVDKAFGWGSAPGNVKIEASNIKKGVSINEHGDFTYPTPAVKMAVKNVGKEPLDSFGLNCSFLDIENKRKIDGFGHASGLIEPGWESSSYIYDISGQKYLDVIGSNKPIDFDIKVTIYIETKTGIETLYETVFEPSDLDSLPELEN